MDEPEARCTASTVRPSGASLAARQAGATFAQITEATAAVEARRGFVATKVRHAEAERFAGARVVKSVAEVGEKHLAQERRGGCREAPPGRPGIARRGTSQQ
jgi:hypothetical protein